MNFPTFIFFIMFFHIRVKSLEIPDSVVENGLLELTYAYLLNDHCIDVENTIARDVGENIDINRLSVIHWNGGSFKVYNYSNAINSLWDSPDFKRENNVTIFTHGWSTVPDRSQIYEMASNYKAKGNVNFIQLHTGNYLDTDYFIASAMYSYLGKFLEILISQLYMKGVAPCKIHLIGFSLGAQISGFAAKTFNNRHNLKINRLTALDPASPCFARKPEAYVNAGDANFVDVIHTSAASIRNSTTGHAEFIVNSRSIYQQGCTRFDCAHEAAMTFYSRTILNERLYRANKCPGIENFNKYSCVPSETYMGYGVSPDVRGVYFIQAPFL